MSFARFAIVLGILKIIQNFISTEFNFNIASLSVSVKAWDVEAWDVKAWDVKIEIDRKVFATVVEAYMKIEIVSIDIVEKFSRQL